MQVALCVCPFKPLQCLLVVSQAHCSVCQVDVSHVLLLCRCDQLFNKAFRGSSLSSRRINRRERRCIKDLAIRERSGFLTMEEGARVIALLCEANAQHRVCDGRGASCLRPFTIPQSPYRSAE